MSDENKKSLMSLPPGSSKSTDSDSPDQSSGKENGEKSTPVTDASQPGPSFCKASELMQNSNLKCPTPKDTKLSKMSKGRKRSFVPEQGCSAEEPKKKQRTNAPSVALFLHPEGSGGHNLRRRRQEPDRDKHTTPSRVASNSENAASEAVPIVKSRPRYDLEELDIEDEENSSNEKKKPGSMTRDDAYYFGLFGMTEKCDEDTQPDYFQWLPIPIVETILCHVPFSDLLNFRLVSKTWNEIIGNDKFMRWKKAYYRLKLTNEKIDCFHIPLATYCFNSLEECIPSLVHYMTHEFLRSAAPEVPSLKNNPKYQLVLDVVAERLPDIQPEKINVWCIVAILVVLAENVDELDDVFQCLIKADSPLSICDVLNAMYCMATFFLYFMRHFKMNHGFHYRLYYVLHTFENATPKKLSFNVQRLNVKPTTSGQQSMHSYCQPTQQKLTYEQMRILNHPLRPGQIVKINAFAGTGKTTVLVHYAKLYPQLKFLNVVFNKSASTYASKIFPQNVECRTAHSLAYRAIGKSYRYKIRPKLKPHDIAPYLDKAHLNQFCHNFTFAKLVLQTIHNFCSSTDEEISLTHVPAEVPQSRFGHNIPPDNEKITSRPPLAILHDAKGLWEKMCDINNKKVGVVHDTYLKLYQLSRPKYSGYDCIMIDEAQDSDAAMLDIMLSQNLPVILVGDPSQQIYAFRGAKNSLQQVKADYTYNLTKSFRFGAEIAYVASCCLEVLMNTCRDTIIGSIKPSFIDGRIHGQYAIIARSNAKLFEEAVRLCCSKERRDGEPENVQGAFVGGISSYDLDDLIDIYNILLRSNDIKDRFFKRFQSLDGLYSYAKSVEDNNLLLKIEIVKQKRESINDIVQTIKRKCQFPLELANVVFSTVHKAKGLEFDTVYIANDFSIGNIFIPEQRNANMVEEYNILYVALTRAKKCLVLSETLIKLLMGAQEKFESIRSSSQTLGDKVVLDCVDCKNTFTPKTTLTLFQRAISLANGYKYTGGPKCMKCASKLHFRPQVYRETLLLLLDPVQDKHHQSLLKLVGPRPGEAEDLGSDEDYRRIRAEEVYECFAYPGWFFDGTLAQIYTLSYQDFKKGHGTR